MEFSMNKEQEAQQAQTIAEDRKKRDTESWETYLHEQSRSYPEDLLDIDHGAYRNICSTCGKSFQGFKRRFICRVCKIANLKSIVDSQAQKIAELEADKSGLDIALEIEATETENLRQKIAEHAKEIEQARTIADEWREKAGSKYDPFPWETTDSKEVAR
jgi:hypothetical protein